ncbi:MAG: HNH endonuclease [Clostridia bacterium]|nr:HNH endonuclease [Clostridia bacterium]
MTDEQFYHSARYKRWRRKVLERAGYLCEECKRYNRRDQNGEPIRATVAHHIKHRDEYPELELEVSNGRALCAKCHNLEHPEKGGARR